MENMNKKVKRMARGNAKRKLWHRAVAIPAAIVVFVTTYALILPAIAMERDTYCGFEAHQHTDECYTAELACGYEDGATVQDVQLVTELACKATVHQHTADCYDETGNVICGYADYLVHEHTADCYAADGTLVCPLPQVEAHTHDENCYIDETVNVCGMAESEGHIHTADCYSLVSHPELVCGMEESAGHFHTADCYTTRENTYLACGMAESAGHIHGEGCYVTTVAEDGTETTELVCTEPESMGHTHTEACYATETVTELTCGQAESAGHTHTEACWANVETLELTCGQAESAGHTHTDACYATQKRLVCPKPEVILHTHNDDCYTVTVAEDGTENRELTCTQTVIEEHVHTADCFHTYEQTIERPHEHTDLCYIQTLTCTLPEHEHTEECYAAPEVPEAPEYICGLQGHTHTELCYDEAGELICGLEEHVHDETCLPVEIADGEPVEMGGEPDGNVQIVEDDTPAFQMPVLACGLAEHEHSTSCMDENMNYVCGLTAHAHTGDCYEIPGLAGVTPELVCDKHEHFHTEACYNENGEIACGLEEHTHGVGCFALPEGVADPDAAEPAIDENIYWCGFEAHEHTEACLDANGETVCGLPEHQHTEACLVEPTWYCGYEPHTHGEGCFDETGALVCGLPEHTHSDACKTAPEVFCGLDAHVHGASCYGEDGALICGLEEHVHTADCKVQHFTQMAYADGVAVTASYTSEAGFPADAVLQVTRFTEGEHFDDRMNEAGQVFSQANLGRDFQAQALLNIGFYLPDGTEVEPAAPVSVTVQLLGEDGLDAGEQYTVIHYGEAGTELLDVAEGEASVNFTAESFSDFLINYDMDPSDGGSTVASGDENEDEEESSGSSNGIVPPINWGNFLVGTSGARSYASSSGYAYSTISNSGINTNFAHNKTIDYLGDNNSSGQNNLDTDADERTVTDDLYRLYLDMEGRAEPVNLLFVVDRSSSMRSEMPTGNGSTERRDTTLANLLMGTNNQKGLIEQFLERNNGKENDEKSYVAAVWFGGDYENTGKYSNLPVFYKADNSTIKGSFESYKRADIVGAYTGPYTSDAGTVLGWTDTYRAGMINTGHDRSGGQIGALGEKITGYDKDNKPIQQTEGTNYCAGLLAAHKVLETKPNNNQTIVIFLSDGLPTYFYQATESSYNCVDNGNSVTRFGEALEDKSMVCAEGLRNEKGETVAPQYGFFKQTLGFYNIFMVRNDVRFFTVGIGTGGTVTIRADDKYLNSDEKTSKANSADGKLTQTRSFSVLDSMGEGGMKEGNDAASLEKVLKEIVFPSNVTITDELSEYVDYYAADPDVLVTATKKTGGSQVVLYRDGQPQNGNKLDGVGPVIESVTWSGKKVTLKFNENYSLSGDYIYTLSFNVKLTDKAYDAYAGYVNSGHSADYDGTTEGQEDTDYKGTNNNTSSGVPGLHSNVDFDEENNRGAYVEYSVDGQTGKLGYPHPVVQAWATQFKFTKVDDAGHKLSGIPFQLQKLGADGKYEPYTPPNMRGKLKEDSEHTNWYVTDENGTIDFGCLECGDYRLVELVPAEYEAGTATDRQREWLTFTVDKGRIIDVNTEDDVTWSTTTESDVYKLSKENFEATVNSKTGTVYFAGEGAVNVKNTTLKKPLEIYKADESGKNKLGGAKFSLQKYDETKVPPWTALTEAELRAYIGENTNTVLVEDGKAYLVSQDELFTKPGLVFDGELPYGRYRLCEEQSPLNYDRSSEYVYFQVTEEDGIQLTDADGNVLPAGGTTYDGVAKLEKSIEGAVADTLTLTIMDTPTKVKWQLKKTNDTTVPLPGAVFSLYGPYEKAELFNAEDPTPLFYKGETQGKEGLLVGIGEFANDDLPPLIAGKYYYLVEDQAPAGFNRLDKPIQLHAVETDKGKMELHATLGTGTPLTVVSEETKDAEGDTTYTLYTVTVQNTTGYELPESGGVGTTVYTLSGLAMLALAGAIFCANRRKSRT